MAPELAVSPALGGIAVAIVIVAVAAGVASYRERHRPVPPDPLEVSEAALVTAVLASPDANDFAELGEDEVRTLVGWMLQSLRARRAPLDARRGAGAGRKAASRQGLRVGRAELVEELLVRSRNVGSPLEPPAVHALVATTARLLEQGLDTPPPPRLGPLAPSLGALGLPEGMQALLAPPELPPPDADRSPAPPAPDQHPPPGADPSQAPPAPDQHPPETPVT